MVHKVADVVQKPKRVASGESGARRVEGVQLHRLGHDVRQVVLQGVGHPQQEAPALVVKPGARGSQICTEPEAIEATGGGGSSDTNREEENAT